jgi:ABC-type sugar transport system ATPase subunit
MRKERAITKLLLQALSIRKAYGGVPALLDGSLSLRAGTVHALCGGNGAGKSTFLNVIMGLTEPDGGELRIDDKPHDFMRPAEAISAGIAMITQELSLIDELSVAENIFLGRQPFRFGLVDHSTMRLRADVLLQQLGFDVRADARVADLSVARKQLVEIARAISMNSRILIMDEPTSALSERETQVLFNAIRGLKAHNVGIIYVTHRLSELFHIADDYTVFRDGRFVESGAVADLDRDKLVRLIVGAALHKHQVARDKPSGDRRLEVTRLTRRDEFTEVSLTVDAGEVLGIYGLVGSGRSEFLNCLFGLTRAHGGKVAIDGERVTIVSPRDAMKKGISLVTEDRKESGLIA